MGKANKDIQNKLVYCDLTVYSERKDVGKVYYEAFKYFLERGAIAFELTSYNREDMKRNRKKYLEVPLYEVNRYRGLMIERYFQIMHYKGVTVKVEADFGHGACGGSLDFRIVGDKEMVKSVGNNIKTIFQVSKESMDLGIVKSSSV